MACNIFVCIGHSKLNKTCKKKKKCIFYVLKNTTNTACPHAGFWFVEINNNDYATVGTVLEWASVTKSALINCFLLTSHGILSWTFVVLILFILYSWSRITSHFSIQT